MNIYFNEYQYLKFFTNNIFRHELAQKLILSSTRAVQALEHLLSPLTVPLRFVSSINFFKYI